MRRKLKTYSREAQRTNIPHFDVIVVATHKMLHYHEEEYHTDLRPQPSHSHRPIEVRYKGARLE